MLLVEMQYLTVERGLQDVTVAREARPGPEAAAIIEATVDAYLAKKIEPLPKTCPSCSGSGEVRESPNSARLAACGECKGKGKVPSVANLGHGNAGRRIATRIEHRPDKDNPRRKHHIPREEPLTRKHVLAAKLHTRDEFNRDSNPETGEPVTAFVHIVCEDGSQADLPVVKPAAVPKEKHPSGKIESAGKVEGEGEKT